MTRPRAAPSSRARCPAVPRASDVRLTRSYACAYRGCWNRSRSVIVPPKAETYTTPVHPGVSGQRREAAMTRIDGDGGYVLGSEQAWERLLGVRTERQAKEAGLVRGEDG